MDTGHRATRSDSVVVTGAGHVLGPCDPSPYLKVRKNRKFMGTQDDLAVTAAGRALEAAGLGGSALGERAGLFLAVGYIPFEESHTDLLLAGSLDVDGRISMARFSTDAFTTLNPLLTFRCLSNMPAFHVSVSFDLQGPYLVSYPGPGQLYLALEEATSALASGAIDVALVAGVAHQRNFLVEHHYARIEPPVPAERLADAAGCLILEPASQAGARARMRLLELAIDYVPHHPLEDALTAQECAEGADLPGEELGPASLPVLLSLAGRVPVRHTVSSRDGIRASSGWGPV